MLKQEYTNCNLCGKDDTTLCFEVEEKITGAKQNFRVVKCKNCGLIYTNPHPPKDIILQYYPCEIYYSYSRYNGSKSLKGKLKEIVMEEAGSYPQVKGKGFFQRCLRQVCLSLKGNVSVIVPYIKKGKILDVGCGSGQLLAWLKKHGWEVYGAEISPKAVKEANNRGLNVFNGELIDAKFPENFFDTVVVNQVLEHTYDPMGLLKEINRILKQKGLLIVGVPNIESYESKVFGEYWSPLDVPRHLYHFSMSSLESMLQKKGFAIERIIGKTFFIPHSNRQSLNYLKEKEYKSKLLLCFFKVYLWKHIRYIFSKPKYLFGEFITINAVKKNEHL